MTPTGKLLIGQVVRLALIGSAMAALYLCIPAEWTYADTTSITLRVAFVFWGVAAMRILLRLRAAFRATEGGDSSFIVAILRNGVARTLWEIYRRRSFQRIRLRLLYVFWSIAIVGIIAGLSVTRRLDDTEAQILLQFPLLQTSGSTNASRILVLETGDNNPTDYLRDLAKISSGLKNNGARAMVATVPPFIVARPLHLALVDSIEQTGVAILYSGYGWPGSLVFPFFSGREEEIFRRRTWFVDPVLADPKQRVGLVRWTPSDSMRHPPAVDALIEAATRYLDTSDAPHATVSPTTLTYGTLSVPLNSRGQAAVFLPKPRPHPQFLNVHAIRELDSDTLWFYTSTEWKSFNSFPQEFAHEVEGRIVFVGWIVPPLSMEWREGIYAGIVGALLRNETIREYESVRLLAPCLVVLLSALLCLKLRPGVAAAIVLSCGVALLACGTLLLATHHILFQAAYPAVAAFLSGVILPLVRISHEHA